MELACSVVGNLGNRSEMFDVRKLTATSALALAFALGACGGSSKTTTTLRVVPNPRCADAMQTYSKALTEYASKTESLEEAPYREWTVMECTRDEWLIAVKGYRTGVGAIAIAEPEKVLAAFCADNPGPQACS